MKIDYALTACDSNPEYYEFWPLIAKVWKEYIGIEPMLIFIGDEIPKEISECPYGEVIQVSPFKGISTASQSQFIRLWYPKMLTDKTIITTDIDMFPLSKWYFKDQIKNLDDDIFVMLGMREDWYNICYNVAKGSTFQSILDLDGDFETIMKTFYDRISKQPDMNMWFADEVYLTEKIKAYKGDNVKRIIRGAPNRIDRSNWNYNSGMVKASMYYDSHSLRPYKKHKQQIDNLLNLLWTDSDHI